MVHFLIGSLFLIGLGGWARVRAAREKVVSQWTFVLQFLGFTGHAIATIAAAAQHVWPLSIPFSLAVVIGGSIVLVGALLHMLGRFQFRSFRLTWGLKTDRLITTGVYRFTRNPQSVGWLLLDVGTAMLGRSWAALALAGAFLLALCMWLPLEEFMLARRFGDEYHRYCAKTPRLFRVGKWVA